jgi:DNA-binding CsgD family transcriptional regulator/tetratricopeptide (TPR) repeat protein
MSSYQSRSTDRYSERVTTASRLLVERGEQLDIMSVAAARPQGSLLLLSGEAGHGKTTLINAFLGRLDHRHTVLTGACDPVSVPTPFAPLYEMLDSLPPKLADDVRKGERRHSIYADLLALMEQQPTVMVVEDLHWADEATLGMIRYIGRRLERTRSLMVASYRPEEVDASNPLLVALADLGTVATNVQVAPLTVDGVRQMAEGAEVDPELIHATTLGNPFFVEEILANPGEALPTSIEAAVMAGVGKLPTGSLDLLEMVALSPEGLDIVIAERHSPEAVGNIDAACRRRLLVEEEGHLRCRHDLIRLTVDASIPPARRRRIHLRLLEALEKAPRNRRDVARLAHHSVHAGEAAKAIEYSLAAAAIAEADGANRQARLHYESALAFEDAMDRDTLDSTLLAAANVHCATNHLQDAAETARQRLAFSTDDSDRGVRLAWSSFFASRWGNVSVARADATAALELLGESGPLEARAQALSVLATIAVWEADWVEAGSRARQAMQIADQLDSPMVRAQAVLILGRSGFQMGDPKWASHLRRASELALQSGSLETVCSAMNSLAFLAMWGLDIARAVETFDSGIEFASANEMDAWYVAMAASKAGCDLTQGRWDEAQDALGRARGWPTCDSTDCETALLLASLASRRGHEDAEPAVRRGLERCDRVGTYWERVLAACVALEAAWLGALDMEAAAERYETTLAEARRCGDDNAVERLQLWAHLSGLYQGPDPTPEPDVWKDRGFEFEALLLRAMSPDPTLSDLFARLQEWGADGVESALRRDLRNRGIRGIPRGARSATAQNPAGLTRRQMDVLTLVARGQTNANIASELFISEKTVGHHVSAILDKLSVDNRVQAAAVAAERGLI